MNTITDFKKEIHKGTVILSSFVYPLSEDEVKNSSMQLIDFFVKDFCIFYDNNRVALSPNKEAIEKLISLSNAFIGAMKKSDPDLCSQHLNEMRSEFNTLSDDLEKRLQQL